MLSLLIMAIAALKRIEGGGLSLVSNNNGLPYIGAAIWISLNELKYSESYMRKKLYAISSFYEHVNGSKNASDCLDRLLIALDVSRIDYHLRTFFGALQNKERKQKSRLNRKMSNVVSFIIETLNELSIRYCNTHVETHRFRRSLSRLSSLYGFLKPERANLEFTIRSLPGKVIEEIFETLAPYSTKNPFRTEKLKFRNHLIINIFFYLGLRRGELLSLQADAFKAELDPTSDRILYWLNIRPPSQLDPRRNTPKLKNNFSVRQIPIPLELYNCAENFISNWRGKCSHSFLFTTTNGLPLADRSLTEIFLKLNKCLSSEAIVALRDTTNKNSFSAHSLRHTAAVNRIRAYRKSGYEMDQSEALMRVFFGWSHGSRMPRRYARAFYQEQLSTTWFDKMDQHFETLKI